jgi:hypothetical protein
VTSCFSSRVASPRPRFAYTASRSRAVGAVKNRPPVSFASCCSVVVSGGTATVVPSGRVIVPPGVPSAMA